jgi:GNAT superfamily N-acetyltransferase
MAEANPLAASAVVDTDKSRLDFDAIHEFLSSSYWAKGIPRDTVQRAIDHSMCFGVYVAGRQVGFARVITDHATFAYLSDVFVLEAYRGQGLSKLLMNAIVNHPDLQGLRRWTLSTRDAHGLYTQFGFTPLGWPDRFMERTVSNPYGV